MTRALYCVHNIKHMVQDVCLTARACSILWGWWDDVLWCGAGGPAPEHIIPPTLEEKLAHRVVKQHQSAYEIII